MTYGYSKKDGLKTKWSLRVESRG